jgi:sugar-specific transcriptional regulator TrmB
MNKSKETTSFLGLTERESAILTHLLLVKECSLSDIARHLSLSRTTLYKDVAKLEQEGYVMKNKHKNLLHAANDETLLEKLYNKKADEENILRELLTARKTKDETPLVTTKKGARAIYDVYTTIGNTLTKGSTYYRYTSRKDEKAFNLAYRKARTEKEIERLVITSAEKANKKSKDPNRFIKTVPKDFAFDDNVTLVIYNDTIVLLDYSTETAISITSKKLARFQEKVFKLLWKRL